jgi:hypothetical protein
MLLLAVCGPDRNTYAVKDMPATKGGSALDRIPCRSLRRGAPLF